MRERTLYVNEAAFLFDFIVQRRSMLSDISKDSQTTVYNKKGC